MLEGKDNIVYVLINEAMPATFMTCSPTSRLRCRRSRGKTVSTADGQGYSLTMMTISRRSRSLISFWAST